MSTCRSTKSEGTGIRRLRWSCSLAHDHKGTHAAKGLNGVVLKRWKP